MASSDAPASGDPPTAAPYPDEPDHVPTTFERRAAAVAVALPSAAGLALSGLVVNAAQSDGLGAVSWWRTAAAVVSLPTLPLFAALPIATVLVVVLAAATSLPVWWWGGGALARRVEPRHGADWRRWAARYATFPLVALLAALVFIGGLTPMGS